MPVADDRRLESRVVKGFQRFRRVRRRPPGRRIVEMLDEALMPIAVPIDERGELGSDAHREVSPCGALELLGTCEIGVLLAMVDLKPFPSALEHDAELGRIDFSAKLVRRFEIDLGDRSNQIDESKAGVEQDG